MYNDSAIIRRQIPGALQATLSHLAQGVESGMHIKWSRAQGLYVESLSCYGFFYKIIAVFRRIFGVSGATQREYEQLDIELTNLFQMADVFCRQTPQPFSNINEVRRKAKTISACISKIYVYAFPRFKNMIKDAICPTEKDLLMNEVRAFKKKIKMFDDFVRAHKELFQICTAYVTKYSEYIATCPIPDRSYLNPNDPIGQLVIIKLNLNHLEFEFTERILFIQRHHEVYDCFKKHVIKAKRAHPEWAATTFDSSIV